MIGGIWIDAVLLTVVAAGAFLLYRMRPAEVAAAGPGPGDDFDAGADAAESPAPPRSGLFRSRYPAMARQAGLPAGSRWVFWLAKLVLAAALPLALLEVWPRSLPAPAAAALAALAVAGFLLPDLWLVLRRRSRRRRIAAALSYFLDLLVALLSAGLTLEEAFRRAARQGLEPSHPLAREAVLVSREIEAGRERGAAFRGLAERTGVPELRSVAAALQMAARHGASVEAALESQADMLRTKRRESARREISAAATKAMFPVFLCGFPVFLVIVFFPAVLEILETLRLIAGR